jgi:hypothetical protein
VILFYTFSTELAFFHVASIADSPVILLREKYPCVKPENTQGDQVQVCDYVLRYRVNFHKKKESPEDEEGIYRNMNQVFSPVKQVILQQSTGDSHEANPESRKVV